MKPAFWRGKRVFLTGHTGFKGAWLSLWLRHLGAEVTGFSLAPATDPALFSVLAPWPELRSVIADVRDHGSLDAAIATADPEVVIHMAAQSLVGASYEDPAGTFSTNAIGTVNLLSQLRGAPSLKVILVVTSDKVYEPVPGDRRFSENDRLGGSSPYAASKAIQELIATSFARSYFDGIGLPVATCRAGNVIGGGDWADTRLVPDYFRAAESGAALELRDPNATRPWQFVLDPLAGYLTYAEHLHDGKAVPRALNFGPGDSALSVSDLVDILDRATGRSVRRIRPVGEGWPEHRSLELDSTAAFESLGWRAQVDIDRALDWTSSWHQAHAQGQDMRAYSFEQLDAYSKLDR